MHVDPGRPDLEPGGDRLAALEVVGPDRSAEAEAGVVGARNRVLEIAVREYRNDRPELLVSDQAAVLCDIGDERRRNEIARFIRDLAAAKYSCTRRFDLGDQLADLVVLHLVLHRAERRLGIEPVADAGAAGFLDQCIAELVVNALVGIDAFDRHADLPRVNER